MMSLKRRRAFATLYGATWWGREGGTKIEMDRELLFELVGDLLERQSQICCEVASSIPIKQWSDVPEGARVIEDTHTELYEIYTKDGEKYLKHIGWRNIVGRDRELDEDRLIDFSPNAMHDQPWFYEPID